MIRFWFLLLLLLACALDALARVGGGESYSGGGGSSGGSGGGGGGDDGSAELLFYLIRFLIWLTMEHPMIGIPVDILVVFIAYKWLRSRKTAQTLLKIS